MHLKKILLAVASYLCIANGLFAQDTTSAAQHLMNQMENGQATYRTRYALATFKHTHVVDGQSVETLPAHVLDFRILHRFGPLSSGIYNFFGLDYAPFNVKIAFDYGFSDQFMAGVAHGGYDKTYDAFLKYRVLRQSTGAVNTAVSVTLVGTVSIGTLRPDQIDPAVKLDSGAVIHRASGVFQVLIARKFSEGFALQIMPTFVHADNISFYHPHHDIWAIGIAARQKISKRINFNAEYYYQLPGTQAPGAHNALSFGMDINTGGHVFEILVTNSIGTTEKQFITETTGRWGHADALFGFNISRSFHLGKQNK